MKPINKIYWLYIPLAFMVVQIGIDLFLPLHLREAAHSENGLHETLQFIVIGAGFFLAAVTLLQMNRRTNPLMTGWLALAALGCFYVAGEEISWGQHLLGWATPDVWQSVNDQQETNLHNTSSWLDQKPRLLLLIGVVSGGLIIPLLRRFYPALLPDRLREFYPPSYLWLIAALALGVKLLEKFTESFDIVLFQRASEVEELYLYYFVLLYLISLRRYCRVASPGG